MFIYKYVQHLMKNTEFHIMLSILMTGGVLGFYGMNLMFMALGADHQSDGRTATIFQRLFAMYSGTYLITLVVWIWMSHFSLCVLVNMTKWFGVRTLFIAAAIGLLLAVGLVALTVWIFLFAGR